MMRDQANLAKQVNRWSLTCQEFRFLLLFKIFTHRPTEPSTDRPLLCSHAQRHDSIGARKGKRACDSFFCWNFSLLGSNFKKDTVFRWSSRLKCLEHRNLPFNGSKTIWRWKKSLDKINHLGCHSTPQVFSSDRLEIKDEEDGGSVIVREARWTWTSHWLNCCVLVYFCL